MSNAKIISIIDHEIHAMRSDIDRAIDKAVQNALWLVKQQLTEMGIATANLDNRIQKLEGSQPQQSQGPLANDDWVTR